MGERKNETYSCHKTIQRMINFDDAVKENKKNVIQIGHKFLIIHIEY